MVKDKSSNSRIFDKDGFRKRAACICVKNEDETEVLLVSSSKYPERWIVPGGGVEQDETNAETAVREIKEEAGVVGRLSRCLGVFENEEHKHRTEVFVLIVTEEQEEWDDSKTIGRKRAWFSITEALEKLAQHKPNQINYLKKLKSFPLTT